MRLIHAQILLAIWLGACTYLLKTSNIRHHSGLRLKPDFSEVPKNKEIVRSYFPDPIEFEHMWNIVLCESSGAQHFMDGSTLEGIKNPGDKGIFQINEPVHAEMIRSIGYNIHTTEGNVAFAKHLRELYGDKPWNSSRGCWEKRDALVANK